MSIIGSIYEDVTTEVLGTIGAWQWLVVMLSTVIVSTSMFSGYEDMFLMQPPRGAMCIPPELYEATNSSLCTVSNDSGEIKCGKWHLTLFWFVWLKKSWLVFCDSKIKLLSTTMVTRMGLMFGCVIFGVLADSAGRKVATAVDMFAQLAMGVALTFCDSPAWFQLCIFLKSLLGGATMYMGLVLVCEISSNCWRSRLAAVVSAPRLLSITFAVPFANLFPNLETLYFMSALFTVVLAVVMRWIPESPQWMLFNRKICDAEKLLYNAAKKNGIMLCSEFKIRPVNHRAYRCLDDSRTCADLITTYNIRVLILVTLIMWFMFSLRWSYMYAKVFSNPDHNLSLLLCFIVVYIAATVLLSKELMLKNLLLLHLLLSGLCASIDIVIGHTSTFLLSSMALASGLIAYGLLLIITPRVFATRIRATLVGCCHAIGQLGTMVGYLIFALQPLDNVVYIPAEVGVTLTLAALCLVLVDVDGRELPDLIEDMDYYSDLSKRLRWATQKTDSPSMEEVEMRIHSFGSAGRYSSDRSEVRPPARRIGFITFWFRFRDRLRRALR